MLESLLLFWIQGVLTIVTPLTHVCMQPEDNWDAILKSDMQFQCHVEMSVLVVHFLLWISVLCIMMSSYMNFTTYNSHVKTITVCSSYTKYCSVTKECPPHILSQ